MSKTVLHCLCLSAQLLLAMHANAIEINLALRFDATARYSESVIKLAGEKSGENFIVNTANSRVNAPEWRNALEAGHVDVIWSVSTPELEDRFLRIPYDIYFGYMGVRVCVSSIEAKDKLAAVKNIADLSKISIGSGIGWSDTDKLSNAGMTVVQDNMDQLVGKTRSGEIDCFARGIFEPWDEAIKYVQRGITDLTINSTFAVKYDNPFYLYVNKDNVELYDALNEGLSRAHKDGSLEALFKNSRQYAQYDKNANMQDRVLIELKSN